MFSIRAGFREGFGARHLVLPQGEALDHHARFHEHMKLNAGKIASDFGALATLSFEDTAISASLSGR